MFRGGAPAASLAKAPVHQVCNDDERGAVGEYYADILVRDTTVVELKCVDRLTNEHLSQCLNDQRASGLSRCPVIVATPPLFGSGAQKPTELLSSQT